MQNMDSFSLDTDHSEVSSRVWPRINTPAMRMMLAALYDYLESFLICHFIEIWFKTFA